MMLECDEKGDVFLDPDLVSAKLSLTPHELQRRMKIGLVTSLVEAGIGEDEGLRRITVRCGAVAWRAIVDGQNMIVSEELVNLGRTVHRASNGP